MLHQKWAETDWIQIDNSWNCFFLLFFDNFFTIHFDRCQTSYWCTISGCFFLISAVMVVCRSVVKHLTLTPFFFRFFRTLLHPSASIALDDETSVTCITSKSSTLLVFSSITVYVPYFAQCPGLWHRPSPHISNFGNFLLHLVGCLGGLSKLCQLQE